MSQSGWGTQGPPGPSEWNRGTASWPAAPVQGYGQRPVQPASGAPGTPPSYGHQGYRQSTGQPYGQPSYGQTAPQPPPYPPAQPGYGPPPGAPRPGSPQPGYPQPGYPQPGYPQPGLPPAGYLRPPAYTPPRKHTARNVILAAVAVVALGTALLLIVSQLAGPSGTQYKNGNYTAPAEDLNPPAIPFPQTKAEAVSWTQHNKFYDETMPVPIRCDNTPRTAAVGTWSDDQLKEYLRNITACLMTAWHLPVEQAGFEVYRPSVTIYGKSVDSPCGQSGINAFYCPANQQMYFSDLLAKAVGFADVDTMLLFVVWAHEFGHNLQGRTGILGGEAALEQLAGRTSDAGLEMSRRTELQADCFSGMFVHAVAVSIGLNQDDLKLISTVQARLGDSPDKLGDHGHAEARQRWWMAGYGSDKIATCNTFIVPADQVI